MRLLIRVLGTLYTVRQNLFKLPAVHTASLPYIWTRNMRASRVFRWSYALWPLIFFRPFRLYSPGGAPAFLSAPCATVTCCFQSSTRRFPQSRCARNPRHRAVERSYDNQAVVRQPLFSNAGDRSSRLAARPALPVLSARHLRRRPPWPPQAEPKGGSFSGVASGRHLPTSGATKWKRRTRRERCRFCETAAEKPHA